MDAKTVARFWSKVNKDGPVPPHQPELGPCWIWTAGGFDTGYGSFWVDGTSRGAHCVAWELVHGQIQPELSILHRCDVKRCVNNERHLFAGTQRENIADMIGKGRKAATHGALHGMSRLTEDDVRAIRAANDTNDALAGRFRIRPDYVSQIRRRMRWKHINP